MISLAFAKVFSMKYFCLLIRESYLPRTFPRYTVCVYITKPYPFSLLESSTMWLHSHYQVHANIHYSLYVLHTIESLLTPNGCIDPIKNSPGIIISKVSCVSIHCLQSKSYISMSSTSVCLSISSGCNHMIESNSIGCRLPACTSCL